jgi:hypothetical protein
MRLALLTVLVVVIAAQSLPAVPQPATGSGLAFLCSDISGNYMGAPDWRTEPDQMTGQQVLLHFKGDGKLGEIAWSLGNKEYYRGPALGVAMNSGFGLVVLADDRIETYAYSAATTELLFTQTRAGNNVLPNVVKSYHGRCKPAGNQVKK